MEDEDARKDLHKQVGTRNRTSNEKIYDEKFVKVEFESGGYKLLNARSTISKWEISSHGYRRVIEKPLPMRLNPKCMQFS